MRKLKDKLLEHELQIVDTIQSKNGITIFVLNNGQILKHFDQTTDNSEIECYKELSKEDISIVEHIVLDSHNLILKDVTRDSDYRIGEARDLNNKHVVKNMANWFNQLHTIKTSKFTFLKKITLEFDEEKIRKCEKHYNNPFFTLLKESFTILNSYLKSREHVLIHDDFYYKNLFVNENTSEVKIFDFNYMKLGLKSQELHFICKVMANNGNQENTFLSTYKNYDQLEYDVYSIYETYSMLAFVSTLESVPDYSEKKIKELGSNVWYDSLKEVIKKVRNINRIEL